MGIMQKKRMIAVSIMLVFLLVIAGVLGGIKLYRVHKARQCGIVLCFDDYNAANWEEYFDLFDKYGAKVTFFVNCSEPTDFCDHAVERGHEIGFHTINHTDLRTVSSEEVYEQAIAPLEVFREKGFDITTFAYPYGSYDQELNDLLLQHYKVLRGAYFYQLVGKHEMRNGFVESLSIDNINYESDEQFEKRIDEILDELSQNVGAVVSLYSHAISGGGWCVTDDRLEYILKKAHEMGIQFYTFKELQKN